MYSPSLALLWQTWGRHRWGLGLAFVGLLGLIGLHQALPANLLLSEAEIALFAIPLGCVFVYIFYAFSYADLGPRAKGSGVPAWMFTLPVRTWMLVAWPMLSGAGAIALLWLLMARFILNPAGLDLPLGWPALGLAVTLTWVQAVDWSPFGAPIKFLAAGLGLAALWYNLTRGPYQEITRFLLPFCLGITYLAAIAGVKRARRGSLSTTRVKRFSQLHVSLPRQVRWKRHASAVRAQLWLECRRNGLLLPVVVGCWLLFFTVLLAYAGDARAVGTFMMSNLYVLPVLAILVGAVLGKGDVWARPFRLSAFAATRPLGTDVMVQAKFQMAALSLLLSGALIVTIFLAWCVWKGSLMMLGQVWDHWLPCRTEVEVVAIPLLCAIGYFGFCWLQLAGHLWVGLTGRFWVFAGVMVFYLVLVPNFLVVQSGWVMTHPEAARTLESAQRWLFGGAVACKFLVAGWVFARAYRRGLWSGRALATIVVLWLLTVTSLGVFYGWQFTHQFRTWANIPEDYFANTLALIVLFSPLTRLAAAPLALAWNRHRKT